MKAYICNQCGKQEEPQKNFDMPREGWYALTHYVPPYPNLHVCSTTCLVTLATHRLLNEVGTAPAEVPLTDPLAAPIDRLDEVH